MRAGRRVAVIVPAHDEQELIQSTIQTIPAWVDHVVVVDDASRDDTALAVHAVLSDRVELIRHGVNRGVGAAIVTGYRRALARGADVLVVMAGDNQMDPEDLPALVQPLLDDRADYVKGNRFRHSEAARMPIERRIGSASLAWLTRTLTGLSVDDTQCGYTALTAHAARALPLSELWPRYGYPNDLLGMCPSRGVRVHEVPVRPVYAGEKSGLRPWHVLSIAWVATRRTLRERELIQRTRSVAEGEAVP